MQQDNCDMLRAVVIDARLRETHNLHILQSVLMATCASPFPFPITKMNDLQYLLVLPPGIDREAFLAAHANHLRETGYVAFPWSRSVNGTHLPMKYKVWVELKGMSPCSWTVEHLLRAAGYFGIVLEHGPMAAVASLEKMRAVVAVPDLALVPEFTGIWVRGIMRKVAVQVHAWIEEPIPMVIEPDTTPPAAFFDRVRTNSYNQSLSLENSNNADTLSVDFETLFGIWSAMSAGNERSELEQILNNSPLFKERIDSAEGAKATGSHRAELSRQLELEKNKGAMVELETSVEGKIVENSVPVQGQISINGGSEPNSYADGTVLENRGLTLTIPAQRDYGESSKGPTSVTHAGNNETGLTLTSAEINQAGENILRAILKGPTTTQYENSSPISSLTALSPRDNSGPSQNNNNLGVIKMGLYPLELTGGVPLPSNVDPQIAANFKENKGPHKRCLTPYLTLPPSPISHPWLYTQKEIDDYKAKLQICLTVTEGAPEPVLDSETQPLISRGNDDMDYELSENSEPNNDHGMDGRHSDNEERAKKIAKSTTTTPRRSRRIFENPPTLTYSPKKTRQQKGMPKNDGAAPVDPELVTAITRALEQEVINAVPLDSEVVSDVSKYCGTHLTTNLTHCQGRASSEQIRETMAKEYNMDEESILKSLEYDPYEDAFTDDEEIWEEGATVEEEPEEETEEVPEGEEEELEPEDDAPGSNE